MSMAPAESPPPPPPPLPSAVASWYDAGIRLRPTEEGTVPAEEEEEEEEEPPPKLTASAEASLAAAAISSLAVLGVDVAGAGVVENLDAVVLVGGLALSQVDEQGPVGETLRAVGNATSFVTREAVVPAAKGVSSFYTKNEVGYKARALLEVGIESLLYAVDPRRKAREEAEAEAARAAAAAAAERARKDALPWWSPEKYS